MAKTVKNKSKKNDKASVKPKSAKNASSPAPKVPTVIQSLKDRIAASAANAPKKETFPADAPTPIVNEAPVATPVETPRENDTETTNDAPPEATNRFVGEQPAKDTQAPKSNIPEHLKNVGPRTPHSDEDKLEKFIIANNITRTISEEQLSKSGINMTKINLLTGRIGKFKLKRGFRKEKFLIVIES